MLRMITGVLLGRLHLKPYENTWTCAYPHNSAIPLIRNIFTCIQRDPYKKVQSSIVLHRTALITPYKDNAEPKTPNTKEHLLCCLFYAKFKKTGEPNYKVFTASMWLSLRKEEGAVRGRTGSLWYQQCSMFLTWITADSFMLLWLFWRSVNISK